MSDLPGPVAKKRDELIDEVEDSYKRGIAPNASINYMCMEYKNGFNACYTEFTAPLVEFAEAIECDCDATYENDKPHSSLCLLTFARKALDKVRGVG